MKTIKLFTPVLKTGLLMTVLAAILVFASGCSATLPPSAVAPQAETPSKRVLRPAHETENSLYYYTESQLLLNKGDMDGALSFLQKAIEADPDSMFLKRELALLYWQKKETNAAESVMASLVSRDPDDVENLIIYARIKHSLNKLDEAKSAYEKVIAADPAKKNIYLLLGDLYTETGELDFALQIYNGLVRQFPDFAAGYYLLGRVYDLKNNPVKAENNFGKALDLDPGFDEARYDLIEAYEKAIWGPSQQLDKNKRQYYDKRIIALYNEILERNPDDIRAAIALGYYYHRQKKTGEAEKLLKALGKRGQKDKHILQYVLELYVNEKKFDAALAILKYMQKGSPDSSEINYIMGLAYDGKKDPDAAIRYLGKIAPGSIFFKNAVVHTIFLYQEEGRLAEAVKYLENMIRVHDQEPEFYMYLGTLHEEAGAYEKAEAVLKQGISLAPEDEKFYFRMGVVYDKWGRKEDSIRMMREAIRLNPDDANTLNYLGYTYADMGQNLDEAEELIKAALRIKPDDGYIMDSLGWVYYQKGMYEKALEILVKATLIVPDDPIILEHLGDAYLKNNDQEKALENYKKSMTKADDGKERIKNKIKELQNSGY